MHPSSMECIKVKIMVMKSQPAEIYITGEFRRLQCSEVSCRIFMPPYNDQKEFFLM